MPPFYMLPVMEGANQVGEGFNSPGWVGTLQVAGQGEGGEGGVHVVEEEERRVR